MTRKIPAEMIAVLSIILLTLNTPAIEYYVYPPSSIEKIVKSSVSKQIHDVEAEVTYVVSFTEEEVSSTGCVELNITVKKNVENVSISLFVLEEKPEEIPEPEGIVASYIQLEFGELEADEGEIEIKFRVESEWIESNDIDPESVVLLRFHDGEWTELSTEFIGYDDGFLLFLAKSPGLSLFAVSALTRAGIAWMQVLVASIALLTVLGVLAFFRRGRDTTESGPVGAPHEVDAGN